MEEANSFDLFLEDAKIFALSVWQFIKEWRFLIIMIAIVIISAIVIVKIIKKIPKKHLSITEMFDAAGKKKE